MTTDAATIAREVTAEPAEAPAAHPSNSDWPQEHVAREIRPAPDRYRNVLGKYKIDRLASCASCGRCAATGSAAVCLGWATT